MSVFVKQGNQWVVSQNVNESGSINDYLQSLGYDHNQFYSYMNYNQPYDFDNSDSINCVCLKVMTDHIICVITNPGRTVLLDSEVRHYMKDFNFTQAYSLYSLESDLDSAIKEHNYTIQFVADTLGIEYSPQDSVLYSSRLKYNFIFENGFLVDYEIADGFNREARDLKENASWIYQSIETHAQNYHGTNNSDVIKEINIQANAFYNLPNGINNQYLQDFMNPDGSYNFKMLLVTKYQGTEYGQGLSYEECKCICHNELKFEGNSEEGLDTLATYRYRDYLMSFDNRGHLHSCEYNYISLGSKSSHSNSNSPQLSNSGCMLTIISALCFLMTVAALIVV
ncbi:MAG: hypothetical protein IJ910_04510 [Bacteroidaceae bacterium]|nr:hypothetical protein [Bacteroidaceae bacterium]